MNKHKTVEELEEIYDLIAKFKEFINSGDQFEAMGAEMNLRDAIEKAYDDGIISENMHNDYLQLLDGYERDELPERLEEKTNENINIVEQADDKIAKSLDLGERADENVEHNVDSKTDLQYIKDVMNQYWHERDDKEGVLSAVDKFTEIGDAIKKSLEEKKISRMTAVELMEPLREIKDNMCDINRENDALDRFDEILDKKLAREDERDSQNQQQDQQYNNMGGVLGKALNILAKRLERTEPKTNAKTDAVAEEHDGQQKKDAQNKSPLSPEQIEQFESLKEEFLRRYHRAQVYHRNFQSKDWPVSAPFWENTVGAMEPLANMFKGLDLKEVTDTKQLEDLARQWSTTMAGMAQVYNWLDNQRADDGTKYTDYLALDDVWDNMDRVDDVAGRFFAELGLNQQQGKETPKKEYVKPETKVEQKQPEPKQPQEEIKTAPVPETPHDTVDGKKQEKKDVAQEPEDVMKREDNSVRGEKQQNPKQEALLKLGELYSKLSSARTDFDKNPSSLEALNKANKAWDDFYFYFYRNPNLQDFKSEFNKLMDAAYNMNKTGFPGDEIKKLINAEIKKEFGYEVPLHAASEQQQAPEDIKTKDQTQSQEQKHITPDEVQQQVVETPKPSEIKWGDEKTETKETPHTADLSKKQEVKDVAQKPEDEMKREDVVQQPKEPEKTEIKDQGQKEAELQAKKQEVLKHIENSILVYDNLFSTDFGEATYELDKLQTYINQSVKEGLLSHGAGAQYRKIIEEISSQTDWQRVSDGIEKMFAFTDKQKEMLESKYVKNDTKDLKQGTQRDTAHELSREEAPKDKTNEKKQENKDLSQKSENLLNRENQQIENEKQHKIENFKVGNQAVLRMEEQREAENKKNNEIALAAYRRKILERRGNGGNV